MSRASEDSRRMLRARDARDRGYAEPLSVPTLAGIACVSEAHVIRTSEATSGETPHRPRAPVSFTTDDAPPPSA